MTKDELFIKALNNEFLSIDEGEFLLTNAGTSELIAVANELRKQKHNDNKVTWLIDRNVNITNVCVSGCQFCNFFKSVNSCDAYVTSKEQYRQKIEELYKLGGKQLLLQGGMHPEFGLKFYQELFTELKAMYPDLKLHALGPAEIVHIAKLENISYTEVLSKLTEAGLDSLPGGGAEILVDRVRKIISKNKCSAGEWLDVMRAAHKLNISTSATMMFGHIETVRERLEHLVAIRQVQSEKPEGAIGFVSFIPWPFQDKDTVLQKQYGINNKVTADEYIRMIAISRIMLPNFNNIQASWLTVGKQTAQICLHSGANDFGSVMIEENVVSSAGADYHFDINGIREAIKEAGFEPQMRDQKFTYVN
jgi:cyclic dehypoxanthinyl futalosine synthase